MQFMMFVCSDSDYCGARRDAGHVGDDPDALAAADAQKLPGKAP